MANTHQQQKSWDVHGNGKISKSSLKGHRAPVLCLDVSAPSWRSTNNDPLPSVSSSSLLLLSGSEDHTARLWDLREHNHKRRACLCIQTSGDVLSAVFAPPKRQSAQCSSLLDVASTISQFAHDYTVYLGVENTVLEYDLRHIQTPILQQSDATRDLGSILQNQDEVNQISMAYGTIKSPGKKKGGGGGGNKRGGKKRFSKSNSISDGSDNGSGDNDSHFMYLAACDDAGTIRFMTTDDQPSGSQTSTILHHDTNGVAVVPTCAFRPKPDSCRNVKSLGLELASGGTDCKIHFWDLSKPKKPISSFTVDNKAMEEDTNSKPQVCNPPMVYSLTWSPTGKSLAAGFGDGSIGIFSIENRNLVQTGLLSENVHSSSVASVVYPSFSTSSAERVLCSAGSDGSILFWDLGSCVTWNDDWGYNVESKDSKDTIMELFANMQCSEGGTKAPSNLADANRSQHDSLGQPQVLFQIPHGQKINWITQATSATNQADNNTIFVADTSAEITSYTIPL